MVEGHSQRVMKMSAERAGGVRPRQMSNYKGNCDSKEQVTSMCRK